jgi:hypothetical protein
MKLFFAAVAISLAVFWSSANAQLTEFSASSVHIQMGKSVIVKTYVANPNATFANVTVWLGGNYPAGLARFSNESGVYFTADLRNATLGLNPKEEKILSLVISSTDPKAGGYMITLDANTTADSLLKDRETVAVFTDFEPTFPGLDLLGMSAIVACAGAIFWFRKRI